MIRRATMLVIALTTLNCSCEHQTSLCDPLVEYKDPFSGAAMSCHLQSRYSFDDVIHLSVFGLAKAETLNERLRTLGRPTSTRRDNVGTWYVFEQPQARLEAGCIEARSSPDGSCTWRLYAYPSESGETLQEILHPDLIAIVNDYTARYPSVERTQLDIERPPNLESFSVTMIRRKVERIEWSDPKSTSDFRFE
jgi:hypothetical protein